MNISVVIPLLNEEESIPELFSWIDRVMQAHAFTYEIWFIDDGSTDTSWQVIQGLAKDHKQVKGLRFRRNYGKSAALNVGFSHVEGEVVITMDADLQDSPDEIPELYNMIKNGNFDLVSGWKKKRYDNAFTKNFPSKIFNGTARLMLGVKLHDMNCGLKAYRLDVVRSVEVYGDMHRYIPVLAKLAGFGRIGEKVVEHRARKYGKSKFGLNRFINGFLDLITLYFVGRFGKKPMHFFGVLGSISFIIGFLMALYIAVSKWIALAQHQQRQLIAENPIFYAALVCMIIGVQLFTAGFIGEMVGRSNPERNKYSIGERVNHKANTSE